MTGAKVKAPDGTITEVVAYDTDLKQWFCFIRGAKCFIDGNDWESAAPVSREEGKGEETLIKWIRENWIFSYGNVWRRRSDTRDSRTDSALLKEYTRFLTQKQKV